MSSTLRRHLIILTAICAAAYFLGLTNHGVTAWHEAQRLLAAREMLRSGEWIVPTINGHPYLAKPPLFYWVQMATASLRGSGVTLLDTRLAVALFGWLGVVVTYLAARDMLQPPADLDERRGRAWTSTASFWAAAMLATGIDYARSARVGELDMLLPALCTASIWMVFRAWRSHLGDHAADRPRTDWPACVLAAGAAALAGLAKGPPAVAVIALGSYAGMLLHAARGRALVRVTPEIPLLSRGLGVPVAPPPPSAIATAGWAFMGAGIALWFSLPQVRDVRDGLGAVIGAAMAALALGSVGNILNPVRSAAFFASLSRTHPILVLGLPLLVLWLWVRAVEARIPQGLLDVWAGEEVDDNLRPFRPASPIGILEAASYGVGLGSPAFIATVVWLAWGRPRLRPGWWMLLAWSVGGLIVFSLFGKGLARYVLPIWPAMAMVGGIGIAEALRRWGEQRRRALHASLIVGTAALTLAAGTWYGYGRAVLYPHKSPRAFVRALSDPARRIDPARLFTLELWDPGIAYEVDVRIPADAALRPVVRPVGTDRTRFNLIGLTPLTLEEFRAEVEARGPAVVILRGPKEGSTSDRYRAMDRLLATGLEVQPIVVDATYALYAGDSPLMAARVSAPPRLVPDDHRLADPAGP